MKKFPVRLGVLGLTTAIAFPVMAQTFNGNDVYKVMRNGTPQVIVANRSPGERLTINYPGATTTRRVTTNPCGLAVLRDSNANSLSDLVSINSNTINQTALPTQLLPRCVNGVLEEARTETFKTGTGEVVFVGTPNTVFEAIYAGGRDRNVTVNACGFAAINGTGAFDWADSNNQAFTFNGNTYDVNTLPTADPEPICRTGNLYKPASWPN